jgi:putative nucleotidyltransferase with HDIG domain
VADTLGSDVYPLDTERDTGRVLLPQPDGKRLILDFATYRGPDLESDLRGRDFTVNAMALDLRDDSSLIDPLGGAKDLRQRRLRACSPASFSDDPLRALRAVRLSVSLQFKLDPQTRSWLAASVLALSKVSPERRRDEIVKILEGPKTHTMLRMLSVLDLLPHTFPEIEAFAGVSQSPPHIHDVWEHSLAMLRELEALLEFIAGPAVDPDAPASLWMGLASLRLGRYREQFASHLAQETIPERPWRALLFLAALYHDAGKPETRTVEPDGRVRFLGHEAVGAAMVERLARSLKFSNEEMRRLKGIVRNHMRPHHLVQTGRTPSRRAIYRFFRDTGLGGVDVCLLALADVLGTYGNTLPQETWENYLDLCRLLLENWWERPEESVRPQDLLNGRDLIETFGLSQGPLIGRLLARLREAQAVGEIGDRKDAFRWAEKWLKSNPSSEEGGDLG